MTILVTTILNCNLNMFVLWDIDDSKIEALRILSRRIHAPLEKVEAVSRPNVKTLHNCQRITFSKLDGFDLVAPAAGAD
jgi:hypothetical protein